MSLDPIDEKDFESGECTDEGNYIEIVVNKIKKRKYKKHKSGKSDRSDKSSTPESSDSEPFDPYVVQYDDYEDYDSIIKMECTEESDALYTNNISMENLGTIDQTVEEEPENIQPIVSEPENIQPIVSESENIQPIVSEPDINKNGNDESPRMILKCKKSKIVDTSGLDLCTDLRAALRSLNFNYANIEKLMKIIEGTGDIESSDDDIENNEDLSEIPIVTEEKKNTFDGSYSPEPVVFDKMDPKNFVPNLKDLSPIIGSIPPVTPTDPRISNSRLFNKTLGNEKSSYLSKINR